MSTWFILAVLVCGAAAGLPRTKEDDFRAETPQGRIVDKASVKYLKEAASENAGESVVTSPLGIFILLSLYSAGTSGGLRDDIITALGAANYSNLADTYTQLSRDFGELNSDFLSVANKMYLAKGLKLTDAFTRASATDYHAELENVDFTDPDKAAAAINHWADEKTKGHIKTPVLPNDLSKETVLGIFNVIYFKGKWEETFNPDSTHDGEFHVSRSEAVTKSLMSMEKRLFYTESEKLDAKIVELPYKEEGFRMVILLPNDVEGLPSMLDKMAEGDAFYDALQSMKRSSADVDLLLPQFEIRTKMDLKNLISKLGASKIFTESTTGVIENTPVVIGKAFQEAFIKVDEEGATAAAVSGGLIMLTSSLIEPPQRLVFHATHPFAFAILHRDTVLFSGTYYK